RDAASRIKCANNLRQIGTALHHYHDAHKGFPSSLDNYFHRHWHWSWLAKILPYVEQDNLFRQADDWAGDTSVPVRWPLPRPEGTPGYAHWSPWGGWLFGHSEIPQNPALGTVVMTYLCPADPLARQVQATTSLRTPLLMSLTNYLGVNGLDY